MKAARVRMKKKHRYVCTSIFSVEKIYLICCSKSHLVYVIKIVSCYRGAQSLQYRKPLGLPVIHILAFFMFFTTSSDMHRACEMATALKIMKRYLANLLKKTQR